jgi:hypothetical protein
MLVVRTRVSGVAAKGCDGVAEVRTGPQHGVHEGTEGTLIGFGIHLRGCELDQAFVGKGWGGDRVRVRHPVVLKDLLNNFFLRQGEGAFLIVLDNLDA